MKLVFKKALAVFVVAAFAAPAVSFADMPHDNRHAPVRRHPQPHHPQPHHPQAHQQDHSHG
jgi:hypothetical protein